MKMKKNEQEFGRTQQSMTQMRIDGETQDQVWEVMAAVLHLGNIQVSFAV